MPSAQSVEHLMHHNSLKFTSISNGDILRATHSTNEGEAPAYVELHRHVQSWNIVLLYVYDRFEHRYYNSVPIISKGSTSLCAHTY